MIHSLRDNGPIFAGSCAAPCVISGLRFISDRHTRPVAQRSAVAAGEIKRLITSTVAQVGTATWVVAEAHLPPLAVKFQG